MTLAKISPLRILKLPRRGFGMPSEAAAGEAQWKKGLLKHFSKFIEKNSVGVSFFI